MTIPSIQYPLFSPEDNSGSASEFDQDMTDLEGTNEAAGDETDSEESDKDSTPAGKNRTGAEEDTEGEEDEEGEEGERDSDEDDELEDRDTEEEEDETPEETPQYARPPIKAIKAKYPDLFKDFPQLKTAFFSYPQYAELFADVDSAREAVAKAQEYDTLEATLVGQGDAKTLLSTLSENNPKALKKMLGGFSDALKDIDSDSYLQLANPIIEELLYHASAHGVKVGNKNLQLAARHIANFVFANGGEIPDISKKMAKTEPSDAEVQLAQERETYAKEKFQSALGDVVELIKPDMNAILNNKLEGLTGFERKQILKEAKTEIDRILLNDKGFQNSLRALWRKAETTGYSSESKSRIKRAWLDRAKLIAPQVRNRLRQEAISSRSGSKRDASDSKIKLKVESEKRTFPSGSGKTPAEGKRRVLDPKKIDWRKTSDRDILDMK